MYCTAGKQRSRTASTFCRTRLQALWKSLQGGAQTLSTHHILRILMNIQLYCVYLTIVKGLTSCSNVFSCAVLIEKQLLLALHEVPYQCPYQCLLKLPWIVNNTLDQLCPGNTHRNPSKKVVALQPLDSCNMKQIGSHTLTCTYVCNLVMQSRRTGILQQAIASSIQVSCTYLHVMVQRLKISS